MVYLHDYSLSEPVLKFVRNSEMTEWMNYQVGAVSKGGQKEAAYSSIKDEMVSTRTNNTIQTNNAIPAE